MKTAGGSSLDRWRSGLSFILIFAFSSVDSSISPLVSELQAHFKVPLARVLLLISYATAGVVASVLVGPALTASFRVSRLLAAAVAGLVLSHSLFLACDDFSLALLCRLGFGLCSGTVAAVLWWLSFHGVSKDYFPAMIAVLMAARPLATALGAPAVGLWAAQGSWQPPLWSLAVLIAASGGLLCALMPREETKKRPLSLRTLLDDYRQVLRLPHAASYYLGMTVNRMCYFGFYALSGIWFMRHYGLDLARISLALLAIGLGEAVVSLFVPAMVKAWGHGRVFPPSLAASALLLPFFLPGWLPLKAAVALLALFMVLDRIYSAAAVMTLPQVFTITGNKTAFGSLNTLCAWTGLTASSWLEARFTERLGLAWIEWGLIACFLLGSWLIYRVQRDTVLRREGFWG